MCTFAPQLAVRCRAAACESVSFLAKKQGSEQLLASKNQSQILINSFTHYDESVRDRFHYDSRFV